jgi:hypothetical protein
MSIARHRKGRKLIAITQLAKKIQKKNPGKKYVTCQREAAKKLKK